MSLTENTQTLYFWHEKVCLSDTQIALSDGIKGFFLKNKSYFRNIFTECEPLILDLKNKQVGFEISHNDECYYVNILMKPDADKMASLLKAADIYLITDKGIDIDFVRPKLENTINELFAECKDMEKSAFLELINERMSTSKELEFIHFSNIDIYKKYK